MTKTIMEEFGEIAKATAELTRLMGNTVEVEEDHGDCHLSEEDGCTHPSHPQI